MLSTLSVAVRLGARLQKHVGPCPKCGGVDRFSVNAKRNLWYCRGCVKGGDAIELARHVLDIGYLEALAYVDDGEDDGVGPEFNPEPEGPPEPDPRALALWGAGVEPRGTVVERYLNSRKLILGDDVAGSVLRWHAGASAMLALFRNIETDEPQAISRTFLNANAEKVKRMFLGPVANAAIKLDGDYRLRDGLFIGEGIETCLAARQLGCMPAWALGSAGAIGRFPVISIVREIGLLRERDTANSRAAETCANRWIDTGRAAFSRWPKTGNDLNDEIMGAE
jgi:Toprim domain/CHC2 zinc finger